LKEITHTELEAFFKGALAQLESRKTFINSLNVFPVPDGDTGTNMSLTLRTALDEVQRAQPRSIKEFVSTLSAGSLIGARGNSGVILSQIIRGMAVAADAKSRLTTRDFSLMLLKATEIAYKAVVTPVEGTILTVVRRIAEHGSHVDIDEFEPYLEELIALGRTAVQETTGQLQVLAEAHVVDAGAEGLVTLLEGMLRCVRGDTAAPAETSAESSEYATGQQTLTYRYDTVVLVSAEHLPETDIAAKLTEHGDSLVLASAEGLTKVHVHTNEPYDALRYLMSFGPIREARIEDMQYQSDQYASQGRPAERPLVSTDGCGQEGLHRACVVVSPGPGFDEIFRRLGAQIIISGGDTMNPPTEAFLDPIRSCSAEVFFVFPNNKNILLAARQAASMVDKPVRVLDARHPVQAIAALVQLASCETDEDCERMASEAIEATDFFAVTKATKDATVAGMSVRKGDWMLLVDDKLVALGSSPEDALGHLRDAPLKWDDKSLLSVYRGADVSEQDFTVLVQHLELSFGDLEIQSYYGGQAFYDVAGSVE
jgi:DAK2 domain fusion protein YloV